MGWREEGSCHQAGRADGEPDYEEQTCLQLVWRSHTPHVNGEVCSEIRTSACAVGIRRGVSEVESRDFKLDSILMRLSM